MSHIVPLHEAAPKERFHGFHCSADLSGRLERSAKAKGLSLSAEVRHRLEGSFFTASDPGLLQEILHRLDRIELGMPGLIGGAR